MSEWGPHVFFVSPAGDDAWSGRLPEPNAIGTDGPFRSLEAAQAAVRRRKVELPAPAEIRVVVRGGTYEQTQPWLFTAEDSGFPRQDYARAKTHPVTWSAFPGESPVISGGRRLAGPWHRETVHGREAWVTVIPEVAAGRWYFRQLWVDGRRRPRSCLPKQGLWQVDRAMDADFSGFYLNAGSSRFGYKEGELHADWKNLTDIELQFFGWWVAPRVGLASVDEESRVAGFDRNSMMRLAWSQGKGVEYRVENVFEALTEPGEWYLDRATGRLTVLPLPGEDLAAAEVVAPCLETLLRLDGASNLRFEGLSFAHGEWVPPASFADSTQASYEVPGAVVAHHADSCVFRECRILHVNGYGVEIDHGSIEVALERCEIRDMGAGGVRIWHGCRRNVVSDCEIADGGHVYPAGVGVLIGKSSGNRIEHNHIHDLFYSGVSAGWNWGYGESDGYGNLIEWNHIHDIGKGLLSDMGGIYLLGHAPGTRLRFNHIHDIICGHYGGWCIYTDEGSSDVLIESNLAYHANRDPFHQHYGRNNQVINNIFAYGGDAVLAYGKQESHVGLVFERNIFLSKGEPLLRGLGPGRWTTREVMFRRNLHGCETGAVRFNGAGIGLYGSQPFPRGFKAESDRFQALAPLPQTSGAPGDADWKKARVLTEFVNQAGNAKVPVGMAEWRMVEQGDDLHIRVTFKRPPLFENGEGPLWAREHVELFLKPFADKLGMVQIGLASSGEAEVIWHESRAPAVFDLQARAGDFPGGWQATLRIPLGPIAVAAGGDGECAWRFLAGFGLPSETADWEGWQARGHDRDGLEADPLFVAPSMGDFRLRAESPALKLGFVPFDYTTAGVRPINGKGG